MMKPPKPLPIVPDVYQALAHWLLPTGMNLRWNGFQLTISGRPRRQIVGQPGYYEHRLVVLRHGQVHVHTHDTPGGRALAACELELADPNLVDKIIKYLRKTHRLPQ